MPSPCFSSEPFPMSATGERALWPSVPSLGNGVHIWHMVLEVPGEVWLPWQTRLSEEEQRRAQRFRFESDRRRFVVARASLRRVLSGYTHADAAGLRFGYSSYGKPSLLVPASDITFNVTHSENTALLAVARGRKIGVDVERIHPMVEIDSLIERFFSPWERAAIRGLTGDAKLSAFFRCWTCKEAYVKAQGVGLSLPLDSFDVSVYADEPAALIATRPDANEAKRWSLWTVDVTAGYAAALAVEGCPEKPRVLHWKTAEWK